MEIFVSTELQTDHLPIYVGILVGALDHKKSPALFSIRTIMQLPELRENGRRFYDPSDITHLLLYHLPAFEMSKLLLLLVLVEVPIVV